MTWSDVLRSAVRGMLGNRIRTVLTMLGVIIGVAAVMALLAIGSGASQLVSSRIETLGTNVLFITPGSGTSFTTSQVSNIQQADRSLTNVVPIVSTGTRVSLQQTVTTATAVGTVPGFYRLGSIKLAGGQFISQQDLTLDQHVVVLGANVVQSLVGSGRAIGARVSIMGQQFRVIGVLNPVGVGPGANQDNDVFIPLSVAQFLLHNNAISQVVAQASSPGGASLADNLLTNYYSNLYGSPTAVSVASEDQLLATLSATRATFTNMLAGTAAISLLVGGIGIMNIMLVSVAERTSEIGIRRAVGATAEDVALQFLVEALVISLTGGAIGILVGLGLIRLAPKVLHFPAVFSLEAVGLAVVFSVAVGVVFGLYPALAASRLNPIEALRRVG